MNIRQSDDNASQRRNLKKKISKKIQKYKKKQILKRFAKNRKFRRFEGSTNVIRPYLLPDVRRRHHIFIVEA